MSARDARGPEEDERHFRPTLRVCIVLGKAADPLVAAHLNRERL
jgi:hypothetical protein